MSTDIALSLPPPAGNLDTYLRAVRAQPVLSAADEQDLARRCREECDVSAAMVLVTSHLRFVVRLARGYAGYGLPQDDLIQAGSVGLMRAVKRFDPGRGVRLASFAVHWTRAEIHEFVYGTGGSAGLPQQRRNASSSSTFAVQRNAWRG